MRPTTTERMVTFYICSECKKEHNTEARAEDCCTCGFCGKRFATVTYNYTECCATCARAKQRKSTQDKLRHLNTRLQEHDQDRARLLNELQIASAELALLAPSKKVIP